MTINAYPLSIERMTGETTDEWWARLLWEAKRECRKRWGRSTAYRLGRVLGECRLEIAAPYARPLARRCFEDGLKDGRAVAIAAQEAALKECVS